MFYHQVCVVVFLKSYNVIDMGFLFLSSSSRISHSENEKVFHYLKITFPIAMN